MVRMNACAVSTSKTLHHLFGLADQIVTLRIACCYYSYPQVWYCWPIPKSRQHHQCVQDEKNNDSEQPVADVNGDGVGCSDAADVGAVQDERNEDSKQQPAEVDNEQHVVALRSALVRQAIEEQEAEAEAEVMFDEAVADEKEGDGEDEKALSPQQFLDKAGGRRQE